MTSSDPRLLWHEIRLMLAGSPDIALGHALVPSHSRAWPISTACCFAAGTEMRDVAGSAAALREARRLGLV